jgi:hypothetical protein
MGKYKVTTESGSYVVTTEDGQSQQEAGKDGGSYWGDVGRSAIREVKEIAQGVPVMAKMASDIASTSQNLLKYPVERAFGVPAENTALTQSKQALMALPEMGSNVVQGTISDVSDLVSNPEEAFRNKPISVAGTIGSVAFPAVKGIRAAALGANAPSATANVIRAAFQKTGNAVFGVPEEAMAARMKNPAAIKTAFSHKEVADQMAKSMSNLQETIGDLNTVAKDRLSSSRYLQEGAIPKSEIADTIRLARQSLGGVFSEESKKAVGALKRVKETYKKLRETVSQKQVKELIDQIDDDIDWDNPAASRTNEALIGVRTRLDDILKTQNPEYGNAMKPVADAIRVRDDFKKAFGIQKKTKRDFYASDGTVNKIKTSLKESKVDTQEVLNRYQEITGEDFITKIDNTNNKAAFYGGDTQGSRRTAGLTVAGSVGGGAPGAVAGYVGGLFLDKYGHNVAGAIADVLASPKMTKYLSVFERSSVKGGKNLLAVHATLMEKDKTYAAEIGRAVAKAR